MMTAIHMDKAFREWIEDIADDEGEPISQEGEVLLAQYIRDGLDYEKWDLNPRQILFGIHYVFTTGGTNAQKAASLAGYSNTYSTNAPNWVRGKHANSRLQEFISELLTGFGASKTQISGFLTQVMLNDFWDVAIDFQVDTATGEFALDEIGQPKWFYNLLKVKQAGLMPMIKKIHQVRGEIQYIEIHDPLKAAQMLGEIHGMFIKHIEINDINKALEHANLTKEQYQKEVEKVKEQVLQAKREQRLTA